MQNTSNTFRRLFDIYVFMGNASVDHRHVTASPTATCIYDLMYFCGKYKSRRTMLFTNNDIYALRACGHCKPCG